MKKISVLLLALLVISAVFCGCNNANDGTACIDIVKSCAAVVPEGTFNTWAGYGESLYDDNFDNMYGVQYDMINDGAISYTESGGVADEISIMHLKDSKDISIAKEKMQDRINSRMNTFAGYKPEEVSKLENAKVMVQGNYVALIISDCNETIEAQIRKAISEGVE